MSKQEFDEYIKSVENNSKSIDWEKEKEEWLASLASLYNQIQGWLQEYVTSGKATQYDETTEIYDDHLGKYKVKTLGFLIGEKHIYYLNQSVESLSERKEKLI
ncbi:MAG: hypothetical protein AAF518_21605 [Spirochaetota bacterium]